LLSAPVGIVEAPAGYGKSVLASELSGALGSGCVWVALAPADDEAAVLVGSIRRAVKAARLSDLSSVLGTTDPAGWPDRFLDALVDLTEPLLLVVDDAHHLTTPECAALVLRLASGMPRPHRMVVVARRLHQRLETLRAIPGAAQLTAGDIAFTLDETAQLAEALTGSRPGGGELAALVETTGGWASAVVLAAPNRGPTLGPISGLGHGLDLGVLAAGHPARVMGSLVESFLGRLSRADRSAVIQLSHLPYLSPHVVEAVTGRSGLFDLMVGAGLPLARTATGWWEIPGPVAAHLARRSRLQPKSARAAAAAYAAEGDLVVALRLLVTSGLAEQAASLIESLAPAETEQLGWAEMHAVVEALGERALDRYPRTWGGSPRPGTGWTCAARRSSERGALSATAGRTSGLRASWTPNGPVISCGTRQDAPRRARSPERLSSRPATTSQPRGRGRSTPWGGCGHGGARTARTRTPKPCWRSPPGWRTGSASPSGPHARWCRWPWGFISRSAVMTGRWPSSTGRWPCFPLGPRTAPRCSTSA
jgi:hypothetical protein